MPKWKPNPEDRFWAKVEKTDTCWWWKGARSNKYGSAWFDGRSQRAHRVAYTYLVGPIPDGLQLDHLCRNTLCVNPDHLEPVTNRVNVLRGVGFSSVNVRKTHCAQGHAYDETNTYRRSGRRDCRTCIRERYRIKTTTPHDFSQSPSGRSNCSRCGLHDSNEVHHA